MPTDRQSFVVAKCVGCGALYFPRRLICHRCGAAAWTDAVVSEAVVEEATTVTRAIGREDGKESHLVSARTPEGLCLIVGLEAPVQRGSRIAIFDGGGAPIGRPLRSE